MGLGGDGRRHAGSGEAAYVAFGLSAAEAATHPLGFVKVRTESSICWRAVVPVWVAGWIAGFVCLGAEAPAGADPRIGGTPPPAALANPWPDDWESAFRERAARSVRTLASQRLSGTTYGESEKDLYPRAMAHVLAGDRARGLRYLQETDNQARTDHAHTGGIDLYWCFTLKGQVRKYFLFGPDLDPEYRERMRSAFASWTSADPLGRPHPRYGEGNRTREGWGPDVKGGWVDARDTDNLRAMREVAIYLAAEESGNEATRQAALARIREYVVSLYQVGMREWDSSNYHGHALSSWHNLYDFARDSEVRGLAKACLDSLYATAAWKYRRGTFGGPQLRDYGGSTVPFGGNAIHALELYFGASPLPDPAPDRDDVHHATSGYRPPRAVVHLARKEFVVPVETTSSKPPYRLWAPDGAMEPMYRETQFVGAGYQMGTLVSGRPEQAWNPSVFSLVVDDPARGAVHASWMVAPPWEHQSKRAGDQVAQFRNRVVWLRPAGPGSSFFLQLPADAQWSIATIPWRIDVRSVSLFVWPLQLGAARTVTPPGRTAGAFAKEAVFEISTVGEELAGFAMEVLPSGAPIPSKAAFAKKAKNQYELIATDGGRLHVTWNAESDLPVVQRDGIAWDWAALRAPYAPTTGSSPIRQDWLSGRLTVEAGGWRFVSEVDPSGRARFSEVGEK